MPEFSRTVISLFQKRAAAEQVCGRYPSLHRLNWR